MALPDYIDTFHKNEVKKDMILTQEIKVNSEIPRQKSDLVYALSSWVNFSVFSIFSLYGNWKRENIDFPTTPDSTSEECGGSREGAQNDC